MFSHQMKSMSSMMPWLQTILQMHIIKCVFHSKSNVQTNLTCKTYEINLFEKFIDTISMAASEMRVFVEKMFVYFC